MMHMNGNCPVMMVVGAVGSLLGLRPLGSLTVLNWVLIGWLRRTSGAA
jgi:hypothetical protein